MNTGGTSRRLAVLGTIAGGIGAVVGAGEAAAATPTLRRGSTGNVVRELQKRLDSLGYWCGSIDGRFGPDTAQAVMALQKVSALTRDGIVGSATHSALRRGIKPSSRRGGHRLEVDKARQVVLVVRSGAVKLILSTSTGNGEFFEYRGERVRAITPAGEFSIVRRGSQGWDRGELGELWRPYYFTGGIALHGAGSVPPYPASHGCCRLTISAQNFLISSGYLRMGERVSVY